MRTYLILRDKASRFHDDPEIQAALETARAADLALATMPDGFGPAATAALRAETFDVDALGAAGYGHERLDQLVNELLLGVR
jgi:xylose isomerase